MRWSMWRPFPGQYTMYQEALLPAGSRLADFHRLNSLAFVPELSPREMKGAPAAAMALKASTGDKPLILAGSEAGTDDDENRYALPGRGPYPTQPS
jgi:hypothetical protein